MSRRGGEIDQNTGRVVTGRIPRGSTEDCRTIKEGPLKRLADRLIK
jgi:hypothetical protein